MSKRGAVASCLAALVAALVALVPGHARAQSGGGLTYAGPRYHGQAPAGCSWQDALGSRAYFCIYPDGSGATWPSPSDGTLLVSRDGQEGRIEFTPAGLAFFGLTPPPPPPALAPAPIPAPVPLAAQAGAFEATITNDFAGYAPNRIFVLDNGQVWQQTEAWYWYWYWAYPRVLLYPTAGGWKLHFDQIDHDVFVQRIG